MKGERLLCEIPHRYFGPGTVIRVYDIQEPSLFSALYPDGARLLCPRFWFPQAEAALRTRPFQKVPARRRS